MSFRTAYGNTHSENRWRMCNRDECVTVPGPYMNTAPLRRGPAEVLLGDFVRRHHVLVEPIRSPVWGWSLYNDVGNSNHLAGTAVDILAPWRPWGARVLSSSIISKTNSLLGLYNGAIYWGRNWSRADEMHFQLAWPEGDKRYDAVIAKILGQPIGGNPGTIPPAVIAPLLQYGSQGAAVSELQNDMNRIFPSYPMMRLIVDGEFGPNTLSAVIEFQRRYNLTNDGEDLLVDGVVGPKTWAAFAKYGVKV